MRSRLDNTAAALFLYELQIPQTRLINISDAPPPISKIKPMSVLLLCSKKKWTWPLHCGRGCVHFKWYLSATHTQCSRLAFKFPGATYFNRREQGRRRWKVNLHKLPPTNPHRRKVSTKNKYLKTGYLVWCLAYCKTYAFFNYVYYRVFCVLPSNTNSAEKGAKKGLRTQIFEEENIAVVITGPIK